MSMLLIKHLNTTCLRKYRAFLESNIT